MRRWPSCILKRQPASLLSFSLVTLTGPTLCSAQWEVARACCSIIHPTSHEHVSSGRGPVAVEQALPHALLPGAVASSSASTLLRKEEVEFAPSAALEEHLCEAQRVLQDMFGPYAKLVLHRLQQKRRGASPPPSLSPQGEIKEEEAGQQQEKEDGHVHHYYRVSATFRLLGFPIELAVTKGVNAAETIESCLRQALSSDVEFIAPSAARAPPSAASSRAHSSPKRRAPAQPQKPAPDATSGRLTPSQMEMKAVVDELRHLCKHFNHSLKFSVKPPLSVLREEVPQEPAEAEEDEDDDVGRDELWAGNTAEGSRGGEAPWRCRAYAKDEWSVVSRMTAALEVHGSSPRAALLRCVTQLRDELRARQREEADDPAALRELRALVASQGKHVVASCAEDAAETAAAVDRWRPKTYSATVRVVDRWGNEVRTECRQQPSALQAYTTAVALHLRDERSTGPHVRHLSEGLAPMPLLLRMRWQFDLTVAAIANMTGRPPAEVARVEVRSADGQRRRCDGVYDYAVEERLPVLFTASYLTDGDTLVWQMTGGGRYKLELDAYAQALYALLDQFPEVCAAVAQPYRDGGGLLFPTSALLSHALHRHDQLDLLAVHTGKISCYAVLGTLCAILLGAKYQPHYRLQEATGEWFCTLTVQDYVYRSQRILAQGRSPKKGEAWRLACITAFRENFPQQYEKVLAAHPDVDLSGDTMARSSKFRALPRDKRVAHIGNIFSLVAAFAEEDLGWYKLRLRHRNATGETNTPQWVAELEAQVEGEEGRRIVATSASYTQAKHAQRALVFQVAEKYFPRELAAYQALERADSRNPVEDPTLQRTQIYVKGGPSLVAQLFALLEQKHPGMAPFTWSLRLLPTAEEEVVVEGDTGIEGQLLSPAGLLAPFAPLYEAEVLASHRTVLVASHRGRAGDSAVAVLLAVLRAAVQHLGGKDGETLWREYEADVPPSLAAPRDLAVYLFRTLLGGAAPPLSPPSSTEDANPTAAAATSAVVVGGGAAIDVQTAPLGGYWVSYAVLPCLGQLPIAKAVHTVKRGSVRDVLLLAARRSFPRALDRMAHHDVSCAALATDVLTEPVVEDLPPPVVADLLAQEQQRHLGMWRVSPYQLLMHCMREAQGPTAPGASARPERRRLRLERSYEGEHQYQCRLYLQAHKMRVAAKGDVQLVGFGAARTASNALYAASLMALENLFPAQLAAAERDTPDYRTRFMEQESF